MLSKFVIPIIGLCLVAIALAQMDFTTQPVVENYWGNNSFTVKAMPATSDRNGDTYAIGGNYLAPDMMGSGKFIQVPSLQANLSPRFSNVQYGANIKYNMPDRKNMGVPCEPLTFGDMASENYVPLPSNQRPSQQAQQSQYRENYGCSGGGCGGSIKAAAPTCGKGGVGIGHPIDNNYDVPPGYANGNYEKVYDSLGGDPNTMLVGGSDLPIGTMSAMDSAGDVEQVVAFNRLMYANKGSRLRGQGDPIRGDLAIAPCQSGWFSVYPNLNIDLQSGALNVMGGITSGNSALLDLMVKASGGVTSTFAGVDLNHEISNQNINMANQTTMSLQSALGDIQATAYP